jgi:hypothetical protein
LHVGKIHRIGVHKIIEPAKVAPIKLDQASSENSLNDELEINGAHRKKEMERQSSPEINSHVSFCRIRIGCVPLKDVRLAFACPPFVLTSELKSPHLVHQSNKASHEGAFRAIFRRSQFILRISWYPFFPRIQVVIRFETPYSAVDPLADFPTASERGINKGGQDIHYSILRAEAFACAPPDEFLPEGASSDCVRIDLERKGALKTGRIDNVAEEFGKSGGRDENLHGVGIPLVNPLDMPCTRFYVFDFDLVDLAGETPSYKLFHL